MQEPKCKIALVLAYGVQAAFETHFNKQDVEAQYKDKTTDDFAIHGTASDGAKETTYIPFDKILLMSCKEVVKPSSILQPDNKIQRVN